MRAQRGGHLVQVSTVDGRRSRGAHQAATWGLAGFSQALAAEVAPLGIRVTIIEPGGFGTDISDPAHGAQAVLRVVVEERPPLRLALRGDAAALAEIGACSLRCEQYGR